MTDLRGGKPNPGTSKDGRLKTNKQQHKRADGAAPERPAWQSDMAAQSGPAPDVSPVKTEGGILD
jgi:hypothetical protein